MTTPNVTDFLSIYFPGLILQPGLFYKWPIGLRLGLANKYSISDDAYFQNVVQRASLLFQAANAPDDDLLLIYQQPCYRKEKIRKSSYITRLFQNIDQKETRYTRA